LSNDFSNRNHPKSDLDIFKIDFLVLDVDMRKKPFGAINW